MLPRLRDVERAATVECHTTNISDIAFNLRLNIFVTAGEDRTVKLWSLVIVFILLLDMNL